jgi:hypothetical protein
MQYGAPHSAANDYSANEVLTFKYGHSLTLNEHNESVSNVLRPRSSFVLPNRGASYPALQYDTTEDLVCETIARRGAHRGLMSRNNGMGTFRMQAKPESTRYP